MEYLRDMAQCHDNIHLLFDELLSLSLSLSLSRKHTHTLTRARARNVDGVVTLELYKGNVTILGRTSPKSLYSADLASMDVEDGGNVGFDYQPADSQGFIRINSVRLKMYSMMKEKLGESK